MLNIETMNARFIVLSKAILKYRTTIIICMLLLLGLSFYGLKQLKVDTDDSHYFDEGDALLIAKDYMADIFGNDNFCAVLLEVENVYDPHVLKNIRTLGAELLENVPYADDVVSITDMEFSRATVDGFDVSDLIGEEIPQSTEELLKIREDILAKPSLRNQLVSEDGRFAWVMLRLKNIPNEAKDENGEFIEITIGKKVNEIARQEKFASLNPQTTGWPVINADKLQFMGKEMPRLIGLSLLATIILLALVLRSVRGVIFPLFLGGAGLIIVLGIQGLLGISTDPIVMLMPIFLSIALSISYSLYFLNFFRWEFQKTGKRRQAIEYAVGETCWPMFFSAFTTAISLLSFCYISLIPVRWVGYTSACVTMLLFFIIVVLLPILLSYGKDKNISLEKEKKAQKQNILDKLINTLGEHVLKYPKTIYMVTAIILIVSIMGVLKVEVAFDLRRSFGTDVPYVDRICKISETPLGSLYSFGVGIEFPDQDDARMPENLIKFEMLIDEIRSFPLTKKVHSVIDVIKDLNMVLNEDNIEYYRLPDKQDEIAQILLLYENAGGTEAERWIDYEYKRLRVMIEIDEYNSAEAARELARIEEFGKSLFPDAKIILTGTLSQFTKIQEYVSWGQVQSVILSMIAISIFMSIAFASFKIGLIAMIPNLLPAFFVCAVMGYFHIPLDLMTVTVIPMLLGLAVDDTIHFINQCRLEFVRTGSYHESVRKTFKSTGKAILLTTCVVSLSFMAYTFSKMILFVHMGILVATGVFCAVLCDYFVTPNLIVQLKVFGAEKINNEEGSHE